MLRSEELRNEPTDAEIILRMGGLANGALVMVRGLISEYRPGWPIPPFTVDRLHFVVAVAGYLKEASVLLHKDHDGRGWKLLEAGVQGGRPMPNFLSLDELRELTVRDSRLRKQCEDVRNQFAFHLKPEPFRHWLSKAAADDWFCLFASPTGRAPDIVFEASFFALREALASIGDNFGRDVGRFASALPYIAEAMLFGFAVLQKVHVRRVFTDAPRELRPPDNLRVQMSFTFTDGRPPLTEIVRVRGEESNALLCQGAILQLLDLATQRLGPERTGLYFGNDPMLLAYQTPFGRAIVSLPDPNETDMGRPLVDAEALSVDPSGDAQRVLRYVICDLEQGGPK